MKTSSNILKALCSALLLFGTTMMLEAKDIYLSPDGNDTNNGAASTPVKTLSKAISMAVDNDVIKITGFIDIKAEPYDPVRTGKNDVNPDGSSVYTENGVTYNTWNMNPSSHALGGTMGVRMLRKSLTFEGIDRATCGLDGSDMTRLMYVRDTQSKVIIFRNLTFKNGTGDLSPDDQGAGFYIRDSHPLFENCVFENNRTIKNTPPQSEGGAVFISINPTQEGGKSLTFRNCLFRNNLAKEGSAIHYKQGNLLIEGCAFEDNSVTAEDPIENGRGGAFFCKQSDNSLSNVIIKKTVFKNNKLNRASAAGGAFYYRDESSAAQGVTFLFDRCAFISNEAVAGGTSKGGAILIENQTPGNVFKLTVVNSTFYDNKSSHGGGAFFMNKGVAGSEVNFVNCTITENQAGDNAGFTPGIYFNDESNSGGTDPISTKHVIKRIQNTIIENNAASNGDRGDLNMRYAPGQELIIENSFIGNILVDAFPADSYPTSALNYDKSESELPADLVSKAAFAQPTYFFIEDYNCIPLDHFGGSDAIGYGNASFLQDLNINTDQLGKIRPFTDGKCNIGAVEVDEDNMEPEPEPPVSAVTIPAIGKSNAYLSGSTLYLEGETSNNVIKVSIFGIDGKLLLSTPVSVRPGVYKESLSVSSLPKGIYIIRTEAGNTSAVAKIII
jgi:hypothetical protein